MEGSPFIAVGGVHISAVVKKNLSMDVGADDQNSFVDLPSPSSRVLPSLLNAKEFLCRYLACPRLHHIPEEPTEYEHKDLTNRRKKSRLCGPKWTQKSRLPLCILTHCNTLTNATTQSASIHCATAFEQ